MTTRRATDETTPTEKESEIGAVIRSWAMPREALEAVPVDAMALVGTMVRAGQPVALIKVDRMLYQVRPGNHLGQNYGRVVRITETELTLREVVQDAMGDWVERSASLQLQEKSK